MSVIGRATGSGAVLARRVAVSTRDRFIALSITGETQLCETSRDSTLTGRHPAGLRRAPTRYRAARMTVLRPSSVKRHFTPTKRGRNGRVVVTASRKVMRLLRRMKRRGGHRKSLIPSPATRSMP